MWVSELVGLVEFIRSIAWGRSGRTGVVQSSDLSPHEQVAMRSLLRSAAAGAQLSAGT